MLSRTSGSWVQIQAVSGFGVPWQVWCLYTEMHIVYPLFVSSTCHTWGIRQEALQTLRSLYCDVPSAAYSGLEY